MNPTTLKLEFSSILFLTLQIISNSPFFKNRGLNGGLSNNINWVLFGCKIS